MGAAALQHMKVERNNARATTARSQRAARPAKGGMQHSTDAAQWQRSSGTQQRQTIYPGQDIYDSRQPNESPDITFRTTTATTATRSIEEWTIVGNKRRQADSDKPARGRPREVTRAGRINGGTLDIWADCQPVATRSPAGQEQEQDTTDQAEDSIVVAGEPIVDRRFPGHSKPMVLTLLYWNQAKNPETAREAIEGREEYDLLAVQEPWINKHTRQPYCPRSSRYHLVWGGGRAAIYINKRIATNEWTSEAGERLGSGVPAERRSATDDILGILTM